MILKHLIILLIILILTRQEKEQLVIQLASEGKTTKKIAQIAHVSLMDIGKIIRRYTGEDAEYQNKSPSTSSKAFQMFKENKSRVDVAIALDLDAEYVVTLFEYYMSLLNVDKLMAIYKDLGDGIFLLDH